MDHHDWFDDNADEIETLLADKHAAHRDRLAGKTSDSKKDRFKYLRGKLLRELRSMNDSWWKKKAGEIQGYADSNNATL